MHALIHTPFGATDPVIRIISVVVLLFAAWLWELYLING